MRENKTKITVRYNKSDNIVLGYFPNDMKYPNVSFEDTAEIGYIEISKEDWNSRPEPAIVNGEFIEAYVKPDDVLLEEAKANKISEIKTNKKAFIYLPIEYNGATFVNSEISSNALKVTKDRSTRAY